MFSMYASIAAKALASLTAIVAADAISSKITCDGPSLTVTYLHGGDS